MANTPFETAFENSKAKFLADFAASHQTKADFDALNQDHHDRLDAAETALVYPSTPPGHPRRPT